MSDLPLRTARCGSCGEEHPIDELGLSFRRPDEIDVLMPYARRARARCDGDFATLDRRRHFVRGSVLLPIDGRPFPYVLGFWARVGPQTFRALQGLPADRPTYFGRLANHVEGLYARSTLNIAVEIDPPVDEDGLPTFRVVDPKHPLTFEQRDGISLKRVIQFFHATPASE